MHIHCSICKKMHFYRDPCPLLFTRAKKQEFNQQAKQDYFGEAPNVFVGRFGYPKINVGILTTEEYNNNDAPLLWSKEGHTINDILGLRLSLINSNFKTAIKAPSTQSCNDRFNDGFSNRFLQVTQEVSLARKPVDVEINLAKKPSFAIGSVSQVVRPHGPTIELRKARITENPKVPTKVDKIVSDTDFKAAGALTTLFSRGFDEHYLTKLLSAGNLGVKTQRKLVPTRWSITATDDTLGKHLIKEIQDHKHAEFTAYFGGYFGNYFLVLLLPDVWCYELFETYVGTMSRTTAQYTTDFEDHFGRKKYAENTAGGYYAARLAILEELKQRKRQASVLALRFITNEYTAHLGVWVVREAVRKAMASRPIEFASKELLLTYANALAKKKFNYEATHLTNNSKLLKNLSRQEKLFSFVENK